VRGRNWGERMNMTCGSIFSWCAKQAKRSKIGRDRQVQSANFVGFEIKGMILSLRFFSF
jgi:hypothetical protein